MPMNVRNAGALSIAGAQHLTRISETWIDFTRDRPGDPQYALAQVDGHYTPQYGQFDPNITALGGVVNSGVALPYLEGSATSGYARFAAQALATGLDTHTGFHLGYPNRPMKIPFWSDNALRLASVTKDNTVRAFVWEALIRKWNNVDLVNAFTGMFVFHGGPGSNSPTGVAFTDPRIGLVGDGNTGFRIGSIGCPNGSAASSESQIDAGSVQPSELVNPGLNWFLFKMKFVPAQLGGLPARIACYLDDVLIKTFTDATVNFPRGRSLVATYDYMSLYPYIGMFQPAASPQRNGLLVAFIHHWFDEDLSV